MPNLNLPAIDGKVPNAFDIDLTTCSLINRSDVYLLGDASGLLAASEAEFQARTLVESWKQGQIIDMTQLQKLPFRLHGDPSLAMVGEPWTLLRKDWRMVDFKSLGWSLLHGEEGKLWYLYDSVSNRVEGIHICHQNAADLIALASVLIESPVDDIHWFTSSVHPSSFEIFKVVIEDIAKGKEQPLTRKTGPVLSLPPISQLHQSAFFQNNFSEEERKLAILDSAPQHYLAVLLGIKQIEAGEPREDNALRSHSDGKYRLSSGKPFEYSFVSSSSVYVKMDGKSVTVNFSVGTDDL